MPRYYFLRHGESEANLQQIVAGWSDVTLTQLGREQAHAAAMDILSDGVIFDTIISSSLVRAYDTARIIAEVTGYPVEQIRTFTELREKGSGSLELSPLGSISSLSEEERARHGVESLEAFQDRLRSGFKRVKQQTQDSQNVLIVAHAGVYRMGLVLQQRLEPAEKMYDITRPPNATLLDFSL